MALDDMLRTYNRDHQHPVNRATHMVGIPLILLSIPALVFSWRLAVGMFVLGWALQFLGHAFEGKLPTFFSNPTYLVIGPLHFGRKALAKLRRRPLDPEGGPRPP